MDLTENQGGYSPTDSYLASYFFDKKPTLWMSSYERRTKETESVSTFKEVGGERYLNKSIFILVSENTFSLAEKFAYGLKHFNKARIIGQTSAGAAHAIDFMEVNENYLIQLPISRNIHPVTKIDWEGTGVIPNIITSNNEALKTAHLKALNEQIESLKKQTIVGPILKRYEKVKTEINNR
ncbi:MAG: S41 family peptidase [Winogradskyella sp.]|uniref:S41 family peptidase n=1 Tax=Winogradskyella sp. TaxID=1883156 RepID=UPI00385D494D